MRKKYERDGKDTDFGGKKTVKINNFIIGQETEKAWFLIPADADGVGDHKITTPFWVPKSQCQLWSHATKRNLHDLEIVKSIAEEKGLLEGTADESAIMDEFDQFIKDRENRK